MACGAPGASAEGPGNAPGASDPRTGDPEEEPPGPPRSAGVGARVPLRRIRCESCLCGFTRFGLGDRSEWRSLGAWEGPRSREHGSEMLAGRSVEQVKAGKMAVQVGGPGRLFWKLRSTLPISLTCGGIHAGHLSPRLACGGINLD